MKGNDKMAEEIMYADFHYKSAFDLLFSGVKKLHFINPVLDINISPDDFLKFLRKRGEVITGDYAVDVSKECEWSCWYISQKLLMQDVKGDLFVCNGSFGFFEHYWIEYHYQGEAYFIDLTLRQFYPDAPRLAITKASDAVSLNSYRSYYREPFREYYHRVLIGNELFNS